MKGLRLTRAHSAALYGFRMQPNCIMYMQPKSKLIKAQIKEDRAKYRETGSCAASPFDRIARIALLVTDVRWTSTIM